MPADYHPWLVDLYDEDNPAGDDHDYWRELVDRVNASRILDLGCGTGLLTRSLAEAGRTVVGVDPSSAMLDVARRGEGSDAVTWIDGDSTAIGDQTFDLVVMTGNVVQHIADPEWRRTLEDCRRAMRPGGVLAFETRNPAARAWLDWRQPEPSTRMTRHGPLAEWAEVDEREGIVHVRFFNRFLDSGDLIVEEQAFAFRDAHTLAGQLEESGFAVDHLWGDWRCTPFDGTHPVIVVEARARRDR